MRTSRWNRASLLPVALAVWATGTARGVITYVDPVDIVIPFSFGGVYLDLQTEGQNGSTQGSSTGVDGAAHYYQISYSEPASGDWDVNFFFGGAFIAHNTSFQPYRADSGNQLSAIDRLGVNTLIDGSAGTDPGSNSSSPLSSADFGGSGTTTGGDINGNPSPTHMGSNADQFASGSLSQGYIAFVLNPDSTPLYGWMEVSLSDDGSAGLIHRWAYSEMGIEVGQVPEPGTLVLVLAGTACLLRRRRTA